MVGRTTTEVWLSLQIPTSTAQNDPGELWISDLSSNLKHLLHWFKKKVQAVLHIHIDYQFWKKHCAY